MKVTTETRGQERKRKQGDPGGFEKSLPLPLPLLFLFLFPSPSSSWPTREFDRKKREIYEGNGRHDRDQFGGRFPSFPPPSPLSCPPLQRRFRAISNSGKHDIESISSCQIYKVFSLFPPLFFFFFLPFFFIAAGETRRVTTITLGRDFFLPSPPSLFFLFPLRPYRLLPVGLNCSCRCGVFFAERSPPSPPPFPFFLFFAACAEMTRRKLYGKACTCPAPLFPSPLHEKKEEEKSGSRPV